MRADICGRSSAEHPLSLSGLAEGTSFPVSWHEEGRYTVGRLPEVVLRVQDLVWVPALGGLEENSPNLVECLQKRRYS